MACFNEAPAEDGGKRLGRSDANRERAGFNEAPAEDGGKREAVRHFRAAIAASMRPPQKTGENSSGSATNTNRCRLQ